MTVIGKQVQHKLKFLCYYDEICKNYPILDFLKIFISFRFRKDNPRRSSLKNYTSNNTTQHEATRDNKNTTQHNTSKTRYNTRQHKHNTSIIRRNTSTTQPNTSTKKAQAAKIVLYFALFVTDLYIFWISFINSWYYPTCNTVSTLWIPRALGNHRHRRLAQCQVYIPPLSCFIKNHYGFWKITFCPPSESHVKS